jgi:hypothetical protein
MSPCPYPLLTKVSKNAPLKLVEAKPYPLGDVLLRYALAK